MKKLTFILGLFLVIGFAAHAQTDACESGFCPETLTAHHYVGLAGSSVAPENVTITYNVVESSLSGATACWITQNLGASSVASNSTSTTAASIGWFWQFNRKYGYLSSGDRTSWATTIDESSAWLAANDPCTLLLGEQWRLPTLTEWNTADSWSTAQDAFNSVLKIHMPGYLNASGTLTDSGSAGYIWSSSQVAATTANLYDVSAGATATYAKNLGGSVRCLRTFSW